MNAKNALLALIVVTAVVYAAVYASAQALPIAGGALLMGLIWLALEARNSDALSTLFFLGFLGLALWGSFENLPLPVLLVGLSTNLAAWDLSRFRARLRTAADDEINPQLEAKHLQLLGITVGAGFVIALVPLLISLSINFVAVAIVTLLVMLVLRRSIVSLRHSGH